MMFGRQTLPVRTGLYTLSWLGKVCHVSDDACRNPIKNNGSRLFLISQEIILENHGSRLPAKSRFTRENFTIHGKKL